MHKREVIVRVRPIVPRARVVVFGFGKEREARERGGREARERQEVTSLWPSKLPHTVGYVGVWGQVALRRLNLDRGRRR
jgi:hypothetical protein